MGSRTPNRLSVKKTGKGATFKGPQLSVVSGAYPPEPSPGSVCTQTGHFIESSLQRDGAERRRVLLLNASFEPLNAISIRRAVVLVLRGRADIIHGDPQASPFSSVQISIQAPIVIKLHTYVKVPYKTNVPLTRAALMQRDRSRCAYCGAKADTIDHVIPRSRGGAHSWENCVASCGPCNHRKADKLLSELGWTLRTSLTPPRDRYWRLLSTVKDMHPMWDQYLHPDAA